MFVFVRFRIEWLGVLGPMTSNFICSVFQFFSYLSVLKTFLHDPLVEWSKPVKGPSKTQANESGEIVNEKVFKMPFYVCVMTHCAVLL